MFLLITNTFIIYLVGDLTGVGRIEVTYDTQERSSKKYKNANRRRWCIKIKVKTTTLDKEVTNQ